MKKAFLHFSIPGEISGYRNRWLIPAMLFIGLLLFSGIYMLFSQGQWTGPGLCVRIPVFLFGLFVGIILPRKLHQSGLNRQKDLKKVIFYQALSGLLLGTGIFILAGGVDVSFDFHLKHIYGQLTLWIIFGLFMECRIIRGSSIKKTKGHAAFAA